MLLYQQHTSLQIGFLQLDTKAWFSSLDAVEYHALSNEDLSLAARRKRMRSAISEDAFAANTSVATSNDDETVDTDSIHSDGVFVGGLSVKRLSYINLKSLGDDNMNQVGLQIDTTATSGMKRDRVDNNGSICKESDAKIKAQRHFSFAEDFNLDASLNHSASMSSFAELFTPNFGAASRRTSRVESFSLDNVLTYAAEATKGCEENHEEPNANASIDDAIETIIENTNTEREYQGSFLHGIAKFLEDNKSQFQHVDMWIPMNTSSTIRLSHAGYITVNGNPKHIVNRLDEFGVYSKSFSFSSGFGMPGRVFQSGQPSWESNVTQAKPDQFSRVGGAKVYGVNTVLGIPVCTSIGTMVVALYSTADVKRDIGWVQTCMEYFDKLKPQPRWKLTIESGLNDNHDTALAAQPPALTCNSPMVLATVNSLMSSIIPLSPASHVKPSEMPPLQLNDISADSTNEWNEQSLALLLGKYVPLHTDASSTNDDTAGSLTSLRLLLLRHQSVRSSHESNVVGIILQKYRCYVETEQQEYDIVQLILNDWKSLAVSTSVHPEASANVREQYITQPVPVSSSTTQDPISTPNFFLPDSSLPPPSCEQMMMSSVSTNDASPNVRRVVSEKKMKGDE
eukprot:scaffold2480_cov205-Alexandrium_tamarense.AAC.18